MSHVSDSIERGHLTFLPVVGGRLEFAAEVRRAIIEQQPAVVAIELPPFVGPAFERAVKRLPEISVLVYPQAEDEDSAIYLPVEPCDPFAEAVRSAAEIGAQVVYIEPDFAERPHLVDSYPDPYTLRRIALSQYVAAYRQHPAPRNADVLAHADAMAWKLQGSDPERRTLVVLSLNLLEAVLDALERPQEEPYQPRRPRYVDLVNAHPGCLAEILTEYPFLQLRYEAYRGALIEPLLIDRPRVQFDLLRDAEAGYRKNTGETIQYWQRRLIARYTRNLALTERQLTANLFDIAVAARSIADDNYAWEVWEAASRYPHQREVSDLETVRLSGEEVWLRTRKIRLRRRLPRPKQQWKPVSLKGRKKENQPGEWSRQLDHNAICSYPPEDIVIEDYGRLLKEKAHSVLSAERMRVEAFTTSILDGIDLRETIRNWHEGKIYVRSFEKMAAGVGAVVVIFDEDAEGRYNFLTTWLGEHQNESDVAFYATRPFDHMVGPGIGRAEYGGFLMTRPPRRMYDVWGDSDYAFAETKPERLLLAALDYSVERYVAYVAARPPRSVFRTIAGRLGRSIVYLPIGQLSRDKLKKVRVVHILDNYRRRNVAKDYIW